MGISIESPAKINLWLEVLRKRLDGYHDVSSLMLPIAVRDHIEVELCSDVGVWLSCDDPQLPHDERNLAWRAAELFLRTVPSGKGVRLRLRKKIPVAAGLGGGSSNAGSVLTALNLLHGEPLGKEQLHALAAGIGADVPFFLHGRPALATGIGDLLQEVSGVPEYPLVLINPPLKVSTAWVYRSLQLTRGTAHIKLRAFLDRPWELSSVMRNDLERVTLLEYPILATMKEWLAEHGAAGALMSGSGPTLFGVFTDPDHAAQTGELARNKWADCWVTVTRTLTHASGMFPNSCDNQP